MSHGTKKAVKPPEDLAPCSSTNLKVGTAVLAKWRDGDEREAVVVERRLVAPDAAPAAAAASAAAAGGSEGGDAAAPAAAAPLRDPSAYRYYLHWCDFNRRLDSWVGAESLRFDASRNAAVEQQAKKDKGGGGGGGAHGEGGAGEASSSSSSSSSSSAAAAAAGEAGEGGAHRKRATPAAPAGGSGDSLVEEDELGNVFRGRKRRADGTLVIEFVDPDHPEHMGEEELRAHEEVTKVKNVNSLQLGKHRMDAWYFSAIPPEFWCVLRRAATCCAPAPCAPHPLLFRARPPTSPPCRHVGDQESFIDVLHVCEFCLKFFKAASELRHHCTKCPLRHPPGDEIYRGADGIGMWEVDGAKERLYCQNLAYIAKMFLDHKTLKFDVEPFLFYVMTERSAEGHHVVGYFSKEKCAWRAGAGWSSQPPPLPHTQRPLARTHTHLPRDGHWQQPVLHPGAALPPAQGLWALPD